MKRLIEETVFRGCPDEPLAVLRERDDGRGGAPALRVRDHGRLAALEHGHAAVRRAEVDSDGLRHERVFLPELLESD